MTRSVALFALLIWSALLPCALQAQWVQTGGPEGGIITCFTSFGGRIFTGTNGGVFESEDQSGWKRCLGKGLLNASISCLAARNVNLFCGTRDGVYISTDSGATWSRESGGLPPWQAVGSLYSDSNVIFAPEGNNFYISTDDGNHWNQVDTTLTKLSSPITALTVGSTTYAAGQWIIQSTDKGTSWEVTALPPTDTFWDIDQLANIGDILFASDLAGILRSTNHGETWERVLQANAAYLAKLGNTLFAGGSNKVFMTTDTGRSWQLKTSGLPAVGDMLALFSIDTEVYVGYYGLGVYRSVDEGKSWSEYNQGIVNVTTTALATVEDTIIAGTRSGLYRSTDNGISWQPKRDAFHNNNVLCLLVDGKDVYAGTENAYPSSSLLRSNDCGENWTPINSSYTEDDIYSMIKSGPNLFIGQYLTTKPGFYYSQDVGATWTDGKFNTMYANLVPEQFLEIGPTLLAATNGGPYISHDDGKTWYGTNFPNLITIAIGQAGPNVFLSKPEESGQGEGAVYVSADSGMNWSRTSDPSIPPRGTVKCFASLLSNLFAATDSDGIFLTTDNGTHWTNVSEGLTDSNVLCLAIKGDELLAGTESSGVWRRPLREMIPTRDGVKRDAVQMRDLLVHPNPASTRLFVDHVAGEIAVIDQLGREVLRTDSKEIDISSLPLGVYCARPTDGAASAWFVKQ